MDIFVSSIYVVIGFALLIFGGDSLVRVAVDLGVRFKVPTAVIGLTIVAAGTSLPELVTSILAALDGNSDISVGNVVGSNVFNILAGIGFASLIRPNKIKPQALKIEWPFLMFASLLMWVLGMDYIFQRAEGILFLFLIVVFMVFSVKNAKKIGFEVNEEDLEAGDASGHFGKEIAWLTAGFISLVIGAEIALHGAIQIGKLIGMTDRVIGLTIVSAGTGLPELVTSCVAAFKGRDDIAIANVIGSNIMNIMAIIGITSLITPLAISPQIQNYDILFMLASTLLLLPFMLKGSKMIRRYEGATFVALYIYYIASLL
ncbi:MAG: calcium/sodium antiporter [Bdellovibrionales bacterium]